MPTCSGRRDGSKESESAEPLAESVIGVWRQCLRSAAAVSSAVRSRKIDERVQRRIQPAALARKASTSDLQQARGQFGGGTRVEEKRCLPANLGQCGRSRCGHRTTGSHRLERWQAESFIEGREDQRRSASDTIAQRFVGKAAAKRTRQPRLTSQRSDPGQRYGNPHAARRQPARAAGDRRRVQRLRIATVGSCAGAGCRRRRIQKSISRRVVASPSIEPGFIDTERRDGDRKIVPGADAANEFATSEVGVDQQGARRRAQALKVDRLALRSEAATPGAAKRELGQSCKVATKGLRVKSRWARLVAQKRAPGESMCLSSDCSLNPNSRDGNTVSRTLAAPR